MMACIPFPQLFLWQVVEIQPTFKRIAKIFTAAKRGILDDDSPGDTRIGGRPVHGDDAAQAVSQDNWLHQTQPLDHLREVAHIVAVVISLTWFVRTAMSAQIDRERVAD